MGAFSNCIAMKSVTELNDNIFRITQTIQNEFPELMPFLNEMTITIPMLHSPEVDQKALNDYYNSLRNLLMKYAPNHNVLFQSI
ncbi:hypothetical protein SAMN05444143_11211 [Flavobacterium succinicans]|uniref:Uncharacterized protein n=2 Tax=Flavobacteriaceae TaxID=49546 RepID=A0A1I4YKP9_9FLAO|nr:hypothetical protein SAMN05444143_11211 [Flavobacterium succinicans]